MVEQKQNAQSGIVIRAWRNCFGWRMANKSSKKAPKVEQMSKKWNGEAIVRKIDLPFQHLKGNQHTKQSKKDNEKKTDTVECRKVEEKEIRTWIRQSNQNQVHACGIVLYLRILNCTGTRLCVVAMCQTSAHRLISSQSLDCFIIRKRNYVRLLIKVMGNSLRLWFIDKNVPHLLVLFNRTEESKQGNTPQTFN